MNSTSKIKLLIFTPTLHCGGAEKFVSTLCNNIDTEKFSVSLAVLNNADPFFHIRNKAVSVIDLEVKQVRHSLSRIKKTVKQNQPDIILTTANHLNLLFAIFRWQFSRKIKLIGRESSIVSINNRRAKFPRLYDRLVKIFYRNLDFIICQSAYMQRDIISNYHIPENKTTVIHIPIEDISMNATGSLAKREPGSYKFVTVGRLSEEKGIERLIHAVGLLSLDFQFYIIGDGDRKAYLQNLVKELQLHEHVFFEGQKENPFLGMEDADLFLMGSYYEGFPNVLLEAGVLGIPVIAFDAPGGISEIITEQNGILVEDNDILGFASAIREGLSAKFKRDMITENSRKRFSVHVVVPQIEKLLLQQAGQNK